MGQNAITFNREVIAGMMYEPLYQSNLISQDAKRRIDEFKAGTHSPLGAYTIDSKWWHHVRQSVAKYISDRDGVETYPDRIYLTNGASEGVKLAFTALIRSTNDGVLVPIPQYPLYSALLSLYGSELIPYYLDED